MGHIPRVMSAVCALNVAAMLSFNMEGCLISIGLVDESLMCVGSSVKEHISRDGGQVEEGSYSLYQITTAIGNNCSGDFPFPFPFPFFLFPPPHLSSALPPFSFPSLLLSISLLPSISLCSRYISILHLPPCLSHLLPS